VERRVYRLTCYKKIIHVCPIQYIYRQLISYILERTSLISIRWWWCPLGTRPTRIYIVLAYWLNQQFADRHVATTRTHYPHSESLLLLYNTAFIAEKIRIPILKSLVWPQRDLEPLHHDAVQYRLISRGNILRRQCRLSACVRCVQHVF
jgi:hypothetical protein